MTVTALIIGASDVTLDLGGYRLSGHYIFSPSPDVSRGIVVGGGVERVVIKNGLIEGFNEGIGVFGGASHVTVRDISIRNLTIDDPDNYVIGVNISNSKDVVVEDSRFEFVSVDHKDAVVFSNGNVRVQRIEVRGGAIGVGIGGGASACGPPNAPTTGEVLDSKFLNLTFSGIFFQCTCVWRILNHAAIVSWNNLRETQKRTRHYHVII